VKNANSALQAISVIALLIVVPGVRPSALAADQQPVPGAQGNPPSAAAPAPASQPGTMMAREGMMGGKGMMGGGTMMAPNMMGACPCMAMMNADPKTRGQMMQIQGRMMKEMGEVMENRGKEIGQGK
jgi:hypothetical protein